jgi:hypothetical protein
LHRRDEFSCRVEGNELNVETRVSAKLAGEVDCDSCRVPRGRIALSQNRIAIVDARSDDASWCELALYVVGQNI